MKAIIDKAVCTGCGVCVDICPEVFETGREMVDVNVKVAVVPENAEASCYDAKEACPIGAILIR